MLKHFSMFACASVFAATSVSVSAIEARPSGSFQVQAAYVSEPVNDHSWLLQMPNTYLGITAFEQLPSGTFSAHWRAGFEPFAEQLELDQQQMSVNWQQGIFSLWGGELPSLESVFIESDVQAFLSIERGGLAVSNHIVESEKKAVRADIQSGDALVFSGQWVLDEDQTDMVYSLAAVVNSPEGTLASTYQKTTEGLSQWGVKARWLSGNATLVAATLFQEDILAWDVGVQFQSPGSVTVLNYGENGNADGQWRLGIHQLLTSALTNYSEIVWLENKEFQWSTGFKLEF